MDENPKTPEEVERDPDWQALSALPDPFRVAFYGYKKMKGNDNEPNPPVIHVGRIKKAWNNQEAGSDVLLIVPERDLWMLAACACAFNTGGAEWAAFFGDTFIKKVDVRDEDPDVQEMAKDNLRHLAPGQLSQEFKAGVSGITEAITGVYVQNDGTTVSVTWPFVENLDGTLTWDPDPEVLHPMDGDETGGHVHDVLSIAVGYKKPDPEQARQVITMLMKNEVHAESIPFDQLRGEDGA